MLSREPFDPPPRLLSQHAFVPAFVRMRDAEWNEKRTKTHAMRELSRGEIPKIETMQ